MTVGGVGDVLQHLIHRIEWYTTIHHDRGVGTKQKLPGVRDPDEKKKKGRVARHRKLDTRGLARACIVQQAAGNLNAWSHTPAAMPTLGSYGAQLHPTPPPHFSSLLYRSRQELVQRASGSTIDSLPPLWSCP